VARRGIDLFPRNILRQDGLGATINNWVDLQHPLAGTSIPRFRETISCRCIPLFALSSSHPFDPCRDSLLVTRRNMDSHSRGKQQAGSESSPFHLEGGAFL
jgi:hypothetical protein